MSDEGQRGDGSAANEAAARDRPPVRLELLGEHTRLLSDLCARCPHGPYGCCVSPPDLDWTDVARVVALGGRDFVLEQIARGSLVPAPHGLRIRRVRRREGPALPRELKCVFHGREGCTIPHERRPATCNYFLCDAAFGAGGEPDAEGQSSARRAHASLKAAYEHHDRALAERIARERPEGVAWNTAFLDWLGQQASALSGDPGLAALRSTAGAAGAASRSALAGLVRGVDDGP